MAASLATARRGHGVEVRPGAFRSAAAALGLQWSLSRRRTLVMVALSVVGGCLPSVTLWTGKVTVDLVVDAATHPRFGDLLRVAIPAIAWFGSQAVADVVAAVSECTLAVDKEELGREVSKRLLTACSHAPLGMLERPDVRDLANSVRADAGHRPGEALRNSLLAAQATCAFIGVTISVAGLAWWLAPLAAVASVPAFVSQLRNGKTALAMIEKQSSLRRRAWYLADLLSTSAPGKEVRLFDLGAPFLERYSETFNGIIATSQKVAIHGAWSRVLAAALLALVLSAGYLLAFVQVHEGRLSVGGLVMTFQAFQYAMIAAGNIFTGIAGLHRAGLFFSRYKAFLGWIEAEHEAHAPAGGESAKGLLPGITFDHVTYGYAPDCPPVIRDVSFRLLPGEHAVILGENGAGKSTLVRLLLRLADPDEGRILLDGTDIRHMPVQHLRHRLTACFQDFAKFELTLKENVTLGDWRRRGDVGHALSAAAADSILNRLPRGIDTSLGINFGGLELSGGEWQRIALARALYRKADIIILDEPSAFLDAHAEAKLRGLIKRRGQHTLIVVTHRLDLARLADKILLISNGRLAEMGSHDALMSARGLYATLANGESARAATQ